MKSLIAYSSQTGNTLKLAKVIYDELKGEKENVLHRRRTRAGRL